MKIEIEKEIEEMFSKCKSVVICIVDFISLESSIQKITDPSKISRYNQYCSNLELFYKKQCFFSFQALLTYLVVFQKKIFPFFIWLLKFEDCFLQNYLIIALFSKFSGSTTKLRIFIQRDLRTYYSTAFVFLFFLLTR